MRRYTEAQAKSAKKYLAQFNDIKIRVTDSEKEIIKTAAQNDGKSMNRYIIDTVLEASKNKGGKSDGSLSHVKKT